MADPIIILEDPRSVALSRIEEATAVLGDVLVSGIPTAVGDLSSPYRSLLLLTTAVANKVHGAHADGVSNLTAPGEQLTVVAMGLFLAVARTSWAIPALVELGDFDKVVFMRSASTVMGLYYVTKTTLGKAQRIPDLSEIYAGTSAKYNRANPFPGMFPADASLVSVSGSAIQSLLRLQSMDVVLSLPGEGQLLVDIESINSGVVLS